MIGVPPQLLKRANKEKARKKAEADAKAAADKETAEAGKRKRGGEGKQRQQGAGAKRKEEEEGEEEIGKVSADVRWTERGIPNFSATAAYKNRHKRSTTGEVSLSQKARDQMPSLDDFMDALDPETSQFPLEKVTLTTFDMNFPPEAVKLLVDKVGLSYLVPFVFVCGFGE